MPDLSSPNRPLTPRARRRSWNEPAVRGWWLTALGVLLVVLWILVEQLHAARRGQFRVDHWQTQSATIEKIGITTRASYRIPPEQLSYNPVRLSYVDAAGVTHKLDGILEAQREPVSPGQSIPVLVDPANPDNWTDRVNPVPLVEELMAAFLFLPLIAVCCLVAVWQRQRILKLWQTGLLREAVVLDRHNSATAPRSSTVRCTWENSAEKRLMKVTVPRGVADLQPGDKLALIASPGDSNRVIAAILYE